MQKRLKSLARIVDLKNHQRRAGEWRLAALKRHEEQLLDDQEQLIGALNADQPLHGLFVEAMAKHLRMLSGELDRTRLAEARTAAEVVRHSVQLKVAEKLHDATARVSDRAAEAKELAELIDAALAQGRASLP